MVVWIINKVNIGGLEWVIKVNSEWENIILLDIIIIIFNRCILM